MKKAEQPHVQLYYLHTCVDAYEQLRQRAVQFSYS